MKKMILISLVLLISITVLSSTSVSAQAYTWTGGDVITFSGNIAVVKSISNVIRWRIVVDGTVILPDGTTHTGEYSVLRIWDGGYDIRHLEPNLFIWKMKRCMFRIDFELLRLTVVLKSTSSTNTAPKTHTFTSGDVLNIDVGSWRDADVNAIQHTDQDLIHRTTTGYIAQGSGTLTLA